VNDGGRLAVVGGAERSAPPALNFEHLSAAYGPYRALFDVSFSIAPGSIAALLGSNGAGKSTVSRVATGLLPSTEGRLYVNGIDVTGQPAFKTARRGVSHVPEGRAVFSSLTVEENLTIAFRQRLGRKLVNDALSRAYDTYPILCERRKQRAGTLSGGQQRLLSLAKVLVAPPQLLVADELCLGLAPLVVEAVYDGLRAMSEAGTTLLVVEQQVERVLDIAQHVLILERGAIAYDGGPSGALGAMEGILASRGERITLFSGDG
jgi:branched-chain amino acid transport system ATP-binding protein